MTNTTNSNLEPKLEWNLKKEIEHKLEGEEKFTPEYVDAYKEKISNMMKSHKNTSDLEWDLKKLRTTESTDYYCEISNFCQGIYGFQAIVEYFHENLVKRDPSTYIADQSYEIRINSKLVTEGESLDEIFSTLEEAHTEREEIKREPIENPDTFVEFRRKDGVVRFFLGYSQNGTRSHSFYDDRNWLNRREVPRPTNTQKLMTELTDFIKGLFCKETYGRIIIKADYGPTYYRAIVDNDEEKAELDQVRFLVQTWTNKPVKPAYLRRYYAENPPGFD